MEVALLKQACLILALQLCPAVDSIDLPDEDPLAVNQEMKSFLDEKITVRSTSSMNLLNSLVSLVFDGNAVNFSYVSETKTAIETFSEGHGNCLSFTGMFVAMARELGLDVRFREVEIAPTWSKRGRLVTYNQHINVAVILSGASYVVDLFPRVDRIEIGGRIVSDERGIAHYYNNRGADFLAEGDSRRALAYFCKALQIDPEAAFVWANLGVSQGLLGDWTEAERSYLKALDLQKDQMIAMSNLAKLYHRQGRVEEAAQYTEKVEQFQKKNPYYHFSLGEQAYESKQFNEAIRHYKNALKRNSGEHNFHFALAKTYSLLGNLSEAVHHLKKAHKYAPQGPGKDRYSQKLEILASKPRDGKIHSDALSTVD
jgi:tetratricopeptide (TPR) repeat protein